MVAVETIVITVAILAIDVIAFKEYFYLQGEVEKLKQQNAANAAASASKEPVLASIAAQVNEPANSAPAVVDVEDNTSLEQIQEAHALVDAAIESEVQKARDATPSLAEKSYKEELNRVEASLSDIKKNVSGVKGRVNQPSSA